MIRFRCLLLWALVTALAAGVLRGALTAAPSGPVADFDDLLVGLAALALAGCAAWAWFTTTVVIAQAWRRAGRPLAPAGGAPAWLVRAVATACGVAVLGSGVAHADAGSTSTTTYVGQVSAGHAPRSAQTARAEGTIDGLPFPDRAVGAERLAPGSASASGGRTGLRAGDVVVEPGDSLWRLSAERLGPNATAAEIAAETTALHERNRDVVGPDPDLIHPGDRLRPPRS